MHHLLCRLEIELFLHFFRFQRSDVEPNIFFGFSSVCTLRRKPTERSASGFELEFNAHVIFKSSTDILDRKSPCLSPDTGLGKEISYAARETSTYRLHLLG